MTVSLIVLSRRSKTLLRLSSYLNPKTWDAGKLADVGRNDGQTVSKTRGRNPEVIRPNDAARRGQLCPHLRVQPGGRQVCWQ